ncbi:hypothetical protein [Arthrobacter sp. HY1533]|uniref:hypothetical protein n=1 Tax=Arthrobacter sp. HY1533 TaxID=2970919 RepID=UPI0022B9DDAE|nr:hypothetical protein [Arthrobacter sp. HY1533]
MVSEISATLDSPVVVSNRRRLGWGAAFLLMAAIFGSAVVMLWSWAESHTGQILHFMMPRWQLLFLLHFFTMVLLSTYYIKVSIEDGQSVVVSSGVIDPSTYSVYTQRSTHIYEHHSEGRISTKFPGTGSTKPFKSDLCVLETNAVDLLLTCGEVIVRLPNSAIRSN